MMRDAIIGFAEQFGFETKIENPDKLSGKYEHFIIAGMGGSHWAGDILKSYDPSLPIIVHSDYGLEGVPEHTLKNALVIASSYSGNTEETIDALEEAQKRGLALAAVATGGKLLELAQSAGVPYVQLPATGIQPRSALGYSFKALTALMGQTTALHEASELQALLKPKELESVGHDLAKRLKGKVPVIYASKKNYAIANVWKIKLNETGKIPAFCNVFPELNHNEMTGFDAQPGTKELSKPFHFIFLKDEGDDARIQKRIKITEQLYHDRKLPVEVVNLSAPPGIGGARGGTLYKIFSSLLLADWTAFYTAEQYKVESEQVPMVEEFKKLIA